MNARYLAVMLDMTARYLAVIPYPLSSPVPAGPHHVHQGPIEINPIARRYSNLASAAAAGFAAGFRGCSGTGG